MTETWKKEENKFKKEIEHLKVKHLNSLQMFESQAKEVKEMEKILDTLEDQDRDILDGLFLTDTDLDI